MIRARHRLRVAWAALRAQSNRSFYDQIAGIYDTVFTDHRIHVDGVIRLLTERYPDGNRRPLVLDLGCGTGLLGKALGDQGFRVVGLDFSRKSLQCLHQRDSGMACMLADIEFLPISDRCFDAVVCLGVWRHIRARDSVLDDVCRILRDDGYMVLGYFPPKIGGFVRLPEAGWSRLLVGAYATATRWFGYADHAGFDAEREALRMLDERFEKIRRIPSGPHWALLEGRFPRR